MSIRKFHFSNSEFYHVYNRGNSKQIIFLDDYDKIRFTQLLVVMNKEARQNLSDLSPDSVYIKNNDPLVAIGAYVIMDNHFHILLKQLKDGGVIKYIQKVSTAYVGYFNKKYKRTGALFEGKFKAKHANTDIYLNYLYAYIHFNPAKMVDKEWKRNIVSKKNKNAINFIKMYPFSSFHDYCGIQREESSVLSRSEFPLYFKSSKDFIESLIRWLPLEEKQ